MVLPSAVTQQYEVSNALRVKSGQAEVSAVQRVPGASADQQAIFWCDGVWDGPGPHLIPAGLEPHRSHHVDGSGAVQPSAEWARIALREVMTAGQDRDPGGSG